MLTALLAAAVLTPTYSFSPTEKLDYLVEVGFDGFIPVLGGQAGTVKVTLGVEVEGAKPEGDAALAAASDLTSFKLEFNGATLPFTLANVKSYFPKNTVQLTKGGRVLKTDAPDVQLPVRLPGLDARRFPDITYIPIEFPDGGVEIGKAFEYKKRFGDSAVQYKVTPVKQEGDLLDLKIEMNQKYEVLEDEAVNVVKDEKEAVARVATDLAGTGTAVFNMAKGRLERLDASAEANSIVTDLKTSKTSERKLKTTLKVLFGKKAS